MLHRPAPGRSADMQHRSSALTLPDDFSSPNLPEVAVTPKAPMRSGIAFGNLRFEFNCRRVQHSFQKSSTFHTNSNAFDFART